MKKQYYFLLLFALFFCFEYGFIALPGSSSVAPSVIAHRGDSANAPENSLSAFKLAIRRGADCIEVDIRNTADRIPVAAHDDRLKQPVISEQGFRCNFISEVSCEQLSSLCTLEELLKLNQNQLLLNLDLKVPEAASESIRLLQSYGSCDRCMITSPDPEILQQIKRKEPRITTILLLSSHSDFRKYQEYKTAPYIDGFSVKSRYVTASMVLAVHRRGKFIMAWTVNSTGELRRMQRLSVDGIITDDPAHALSVLP